MLKLLSYVTSNHCKKLLDYLVDKKLSLSGFGGSSPGKP